MVGAGPGTETVAMLPLPGYLRRSISPDERRRAILVLMGGLGGTGPRAADDGLDAVRAELSRLILVADHPTRTVAALDEPLAELARDPPGTSGGGTSPRQPAGVCWCSSNRQASPTRT